MLSSLWVKKMEQHLLDCYNVYAINKLSSFEEITNDDRAKNVRYEQTYIKHTLVSLHKELTSCTNDSSFLQHLRQAEEILYASEFRYKYEGMPTIASGVDLRVRNTLCNLIAELSPQEEKEPEGSHFNQQEVQHIVRQSHAILNARLKEANVEKAFWDMISESLFFKRHGGIWAFQITPDNSNASEWINCKTEERSVKISWCQFVVGESKKILRKYNRAYHYMEAIRSTLWRFSDQEKLIEVMKEIVKQFPLEESRINKRADEHQFLSAAVRGDEVYMKEYLDKYNNSAEALNVVSSNGSSAFTRALVNGHLNIGALLLERGYKEINSTNREGLSALTYSVKEKKWRSVAWLLEQRNDIQIDEATAEAIYKSGQDKLIQTLQKRLLQKEIPQESKETPQENKAVNHPGSGFTFNRYRQFSLSAVSMATDRTDPAESKVKSMPVQRSYSG